MAKPNLISVCRTALALVARSGTAPVAADPPAVEQANDALFQVGPDARKQSVRDSGSSQAREGERQCRSPSFGVRHEDPRAACR
jgi:hypothetical protein